MEKLKFEEPNCNYPVFDFKFKKVDWELNEDNIEEHYDEIDFYGAIYIRALSENGDFETRVLSDCYIADSLYIAQEEVEDLENDDWDTVEVFYTTKCECYDAGHSYERGQEFGYVLSSMLGVDCNQYDYNLNVPVICRAAGDDWEQIWITHSNGEYNEDIDIDIDALIEYKSSNKQE